ncbi:unnamed protein product [Caenorhabditis brenneri]
MNTIPLHLLPDKAFKRVLRSMEIYDQLAYSLCSINTKKSIKSLNLRAESISFCVYDLIEMEMCFENSVEISCYLEHEYSFPHNKIIALKGIEVSVYDRAEKVTEWKWNFQNFEFKVWLHHFCEVFHHPRINLSFSVEQIDDSFIGPVQEVIKGLQIVLLFLSNQLTNEIITEVLERFHNYEQLHIARVPFNNQEVYKMDKVLIQNLKSVSIREAQRINLDQILSSNCEEVKLVDSTLTREEFKVLVKLWIRGSNSKLSYFSACQTLIPTQLNHPFDEKVFLKGIKHTKVPMDSKEMYKMKYEYSSYEIQLAGGYRISRFDGTNAVVMIYERMFRLIVV